MTRRLLPIVLGLAAAVAFTAPAGAVDLPPQQSSFSSAQMIDGRLIWFQRNSRVKRHKHRPPTVTPGVGALYARMLTEKKAQRVYLPPKGKKIVSFKAGGGRVVVGLATISADAPAESQIVELTPGESLPWRATLIVSDPGATDDNTCGSRVELVAVQPDGDVIAQRDRLEGRAKCALARQVGQLTAFPKVGEPQQLTLRESGWASAPVWSLLPDLQPSASDWMLQLTRDSRWDDSSPISTLNAVTGEERDITSYVGSVDRAEPLTGGGLLMRIWSFEAELMPSLADPSATMSLSRAGHQTWFHACGATIIEIARHWRKPHRGSWKIYLRDSSGKTTAKLKARLPLGTMFDACDQDTALFHRTRHDGGAHQWAVRLAP